MAVTTAAGRGRSPSRRISLLPPQMAPVMPPFLPQALASDRSLLLLLAVLAVSSLLFAISQHGQNLHLKEEIHKIQTYCSRGDNDGGQDLKLNPASAKNRIVSPFIVVLSLAMIFFLLKWLGQQGHERSACSSVTSTEKNASSRKKRIAYKIDLFFSTHPYGKLITLLFATIFLIGFGSLALYMFTEVHFSEALWYSWTFIADTGAHTEQVGLWPRTIAVLITVGGMLVFATMLGIVSDAVSEKVDSWRKGKKEVLESNHILIIGWNDKLGSLLKQLAIGNKTSVGGVIVILSEREKEEMESDIANLEIDFKGMSIICRSGSPLILADLKKVSVSKARTIIVLSSDEDADECDAQALRVVLSLTGVIDGLRGHVVVEMKNIENEPLVKLVGGDLVETVVAHEVIGRMMIQCALQPGLAQIWEAILGFENSEFYIKRWPQLDGMRFGDVLFSFADAVPCGVKVAKEGGKIRINPEDDYVLKEGDEVLVLAEDDDAYVPCILPQVQKDSKLPDISSPRKRQEKVLLCNWRHDIHDMITILEDILCPGSELWLFNDVPEGERKSRCLLEGTNLSNLHNIKVVHKEGSTIIRQHLESLPLEEFDSILILADQSAKCCTEKSDTRTMTTLILIRDIQAKRLPQSRQRHPSRLNSWTRDLPNASTSSIIITEILDSKTRNVVTLSHIGDCVLSHELVSMALAMVAKDRQINRVLQELYDEEGNELYTRSAKYYVHGHEELSFFDIMARARQRKEIAIGYRLAGTEDAVINPTGKSEPRRWSPDDCFVVIFKDEQCSLPAASRFQT